MQQTRYAPYSIPALVQQLQNGELTSRALVDQCLSRIEEENGEWNCFLHVDAEGARLAADDIDRRRAAGETIGVLQGMPLGIKDNICIQGQPVTCGSRMLQDFVAPYDAGVIQRIRAADGILLGKLNMDEFAMGSSSESSAFGVVRNPINGSRTPGGSSGGSAAAVAAGMVPLAIGSDTGGSIRQPAAFCGVVGMKPTYGRVSRYGLVAFASSLDQIGPLAPDVAGAALLAEVISGHDSQDSTSLPDAVPSWSPDGADLNGIRIGVVDGHFGEGLTEDVRECVAERLEHYRSAGAELVTVELPHSRYSIAAYYLVACSEASSNLARYDGIHYGRRSADAEDLTDLYCRSRGEGFGAEVKRRIMLGTFALSEGYYDAYYARALKVRRRIREDFDRAFEAVDVIAGPVTPTTAFPLGEKLADPLAMYLGDIYTISANLAGIPGVSIPCGETAEGLPVGMHVLAPVLAEQRLFQVAAGMELVHSG